MSPLQVGTALIDRVEEHRLPVPLAALTGDEEFIARQVASLPSGFFDPTSMTFQFSNPAGAAPPRVRRSGNGHCDQKGSGAKGAG